MEEFLQRLGHGGCALAKQNQCWGVSEWEPYDDIHHLSRDEVGDEKLLSTQLCIYIYIYRARS